ncbi:MAG: trigger factor [Bdellovibrionota bacterium]
MDLKISVETQGEVHRNINIEIPRTEYSRRFDDALHKASSKVRLKGFRPGRVPKAMVAKLYGSEIHSEVMEAFALKGLQTAFDEHKLEIVGRPEVKYGEDDGKEDLKITAAVAIAPKPTINEFKNLALEVEVKEFKESDVEHELEHVRGHHAEYLPIEDRKVVEKGDYAAVEYELLVDGKLLPGEKKQTRFAEVGSGTRLPKQLDDALIGAPVGEEQTVKVTLDDSSDPALAGKEAEYVFTVSEIRKRVLPELSDDLAKKSGMAEDLEGLKKAVREQVEKSVTDQNLATKERKLFEKLIELNPFELPQAMVDEEIRSMLFEMGAMDRRKRESYQMDVSPFRQHLGAQADYRVRSVVILDRIREQEDFKPSDEDFEQWLDGLVTKGGFKSREELDKHFGLPQNKERLLEICAREKTTENLVSSAKITEVPFQEPAKTTED